MGPANGTTSVLEVAAEVLAAVRRAKTAEKRSMRSRVAELVVSGPAAALAPVEAAGATWSTPEGWRSCD